MLNVPWYSQASQLMQMHARAVTVAPSSSGQTATHGTPCDIS